jgi:hypothetical protein
VTSAPSFARVRALSAGLNTRHAFAPGRSIEWIALAANIERGKLIDSDHLS